MHWCHTFKVRSPRAWSRMSRTYVRSTRVTNVPRCDGIWNVQRITHICAYTSLGGLQPSRWGVLTESMTERQAQATVNAKVRSSRVLALTINILMHAADERVGAVHMLRTKGPGLTSMSNSVARSCPRQLLQMFFRRRDSLERQIVAIPCMSLKLASARTWRLTMTCDVHLTWSTKNRNNKLDATVTVKSSHVLQPQWMIHASANDAQLEQHRKVHPVDEPYCSCVCLVVYHVDFCGRAAHDFHGSLCANTND